VILNRDMTVENLERLGADRPAAGRVVGFGGGTACDTAKYLASEWNLPLIISPSIVSVDAWLCRSIAVRVEHKVRYIRDVAPERLIVDYSVVRRAPVALNRAGVCDVLSITTALGDWLIARDSFGDPFDQEVFDSAKAIADALISEAEDVARVNDEGIRAIIKGQADEVSLCERWGNARPEEGSEHFLAYCLEEITRDHYIHGSLVCMNILIVLKLQRGGAVYDCNSMRELFDRLGVEYRPAPQGIGRDDLRKALLGSGEYVRKENLFKGLWWLDGVFAAAGEFSADGILDWIYSI
jgi:glycerol-1-phosphate dehydrogenase [NAD(P)+]